MSMYEEKRLGVEGSVRVRETGWSIVTMRKMSPP